MKGLRFISGISLYLLSYNYFVYLIGIRYQLKKSIHLKDTYLCTGNNIPLKLNVGSCSLNISNDVLQWSIDGTSVLHYSYYMGRLIEVHKNLSNYTATTTSLQTNVDRLNVTLNLQLYFNFPIGASISCGSDFVRSNDIQLSSSKFNSFFYMSRTFFKYIIL